MKQVCHLLLKKGASAKLGGSVGGHDPQCFFKIISENGMPLRSFLGNDSFHDPAKLGSVPYHSEANEIGK